MSSEVAGPSTSCGQDQVDEDVTSQSKRMRLSTKSIEITDLNNNCLEHIFKFLNLNDLLNVAGTCKKFHSAANYPFSSNFGKKQFHLRYTYIERGSSAFSIDTFENDIYIRKLKIYLKCLRTFGHLINKLCINYDTMPIRDEIDLYINQYCSDYVKEIVFCWSMKGAMKNLTKPFPNVWSLAFSSCYLEDEITNFKVKFPKMKRLKFSGSNTIATRKCIEMNFPHLENLCIVDVDTHQSDTFFQPNNIATCIRLNPALRELEIGGELLNISFIQSVRKHLQHIEFLGIQLQSPKSLQLNTGTISLNIKRLKVDIRSGSMNPARMPKIPLVSNQLEEFSIKACNLWVKESLMDFIKKHPKLIKLVVDDERQNDIKWRLPEVTQTLTQIELNLHRFTPDEAIEFMARYASLKKFQFQMIDRFDYDLLLDRLDRKWKRSSYDAMHVTLTLIDQPTTN